MFWCSGESLYKVHRYCFIKQSEKKTACRVKRKQPKSRFLSIYFQTRKPLAKHIYFISSHESR